MTRPENILKYCPKCGNHPFTFEGVKSFKCSACGFHLFINAAAAVAAIITNPKGEILLTVRAFEPNKGSLDLPGGFIDAMETAENAVIREIKEELNLDVTQTTYLASFPNEYVFAGYSVYTCDLGFVCQVADLSPLSVADDVADYIFVHPSQIDYSRICSNSIVQLIQAYRNKF